MALGVSCASEPGRASTPASRQRAPLTIDLQTPDGATTRLDAVLAGRVGVVSLWAPWCEACVGELPALARLAERADPRRAIAVAVAVGETPESVVRFFSGRAPPCAQLVDRAFQFSDAIGSKQVPTTLVIDRNGRIVFVGGVLDAAALVALQAVLVDAQPRP